MFMRKVRLMQSDASILWWTGKSPGPHFSSPFIAVSCVRREDLSFNLRNTLIFL